MFSSERVLQRMKERERYTPNPNILIFLQALVLLSLTLIFSFISFALMWKSCTLTRYVFIFSFFFCFFLVSLLIREPLNRWRLKGYPVEWHCWRGREREREKRLCREREIEKGFSMRAISDLIQSSTLFSPLKSFHQACTQVPSPLRPQISPGLLSQMKR